MTSLSDKEKTRAFAQKMREEGAAGFAAGPWMSWEENGCLENPIIEGQVIPGDHHRRPLEHAGKHQNRGNTGDRFFTWVASMAFIALLVGIAGVYHSAGKQTAPAYIADSEISEVPGEKTIDRLWAADEVASDTAATSQTTVDNWASTPTDIWAVPAETGSLSDEEPVPVEDIEPAATETVQAEIPAEPTMEIAVTEPAALEPTQAPTSEPEPAPVQEAADSTQTEALTPEKPTGPWQVNIESYFKATRADKRLTELRALGIDAEQTMAEVNGKTVYRLGVPGFTSRKAAKVHGERLKQQHSLDSIWVNKP